MKILLADDEPIARTMLQHWLTGWGYTVVAVKDGEAAIAALQADQEIRLAVVDWVMPKVDGIQVCRHVRNGPTEPYIYVVLLTARDNKSDIVDGLDAGADDYLIKPCNPLELKVRLRAGRRVVELQEELVAAREELRYEAMHDGLTTLLNRRAVLEQLDRELRRSARSGAPVAVLMGDLDHFKAVNDTFGHAAGDAVLVEAANRMKACVRAYDSLGRIGGEEFLCVLPECSPAMGYAVAQRFCAALAQRRRSARRMAMFPSPSASASPPPSSPARSPPTRWCARPTPRSTAPKLRAARERPWPWPVTSYSAVATSWSRSLPRATSRLGIWAARAAPASRFPDFVRSVWRRDSGSVSGRP